MGPASVGMQGYVARPSIFRGQSQPMLVHPYIRLMDKILHDPKDPKLWELWYIPYNG